MDILEYIKQMQEMYGEDVITTADKINRPEPKREVKEIELFNEFNTRNPQADGGRAGYNDGQLVTPSVDGSRPGYSGVYKRKDKPGYSTKWRVMGERGGINVSKWLKSQGLESTYTNKKAADAAYQKFLDANPDKLSDVTKAKWMKEGETLATKFNTLVQKNFDAGDMSKTPSWEAFLKKQKLKHAGVGTYQAQRVNLGAVDISPMKRDLADKLIKEASKDLKYIPWMEIQRKLSPSVDINTTQWRVFIDRHNKINGQSAKVKQAFDYLKDNDVALKIPKNLSKTMAMEGSLLRKVIFGLTGVNTRGIREGLAGLDEATKSQIDFANKGNLWTEGQGRTLTEILDDADYRMDGNISWSSDIKKLAGRPNKNAFDYALRNFNYYGKKGEVGQIQFYYKDDKGMKNPIKWNEIEWDNKGGKKLKPSKVFFVDSTEKKPIKTQWTTEKIDADHANWKFNKKNPSLPKKPTAGLLDELYQAKDVYDNLLNTEVTDPRNPKGAKVKFGKIMKDVYGEGYDNFGNPYAIEHGDTIAKKPWTNLRIAEQRINSALYNITRKKGISEGVRKQIINQLNKQTYNVFDKDAITKIISSQEGVISDVLDRNKKYNRSVLDEMLQKIPKGERGFIEKALLRDIAKVGGKGIRVATKYFGIPDAIFSTVDYLNERSKGKSKKESKAQAIKNLTFGAVKNKEYMKELKKTAESMGIDARAFEDVYNLNVAGQTFDKYLIKGQEEIKNLRKLGYNEKADNAQKNLDRYIEEQNENLGNLSQKIINQISISKAGGAASPLQLSKARDILTEDDFYKPFKDITKTAKEKLTREKRKAFPTQSRQFDTSPGSMGERFYTAVDALTQGAKNVLQGRIIPYGPKRFRPLESERQKQKRYLREMEPRELYLYNKDRRYTYDQPLTETDLEDLRYEQPGVFYASGGLASLTDTIPPESGPMSQGLRSLYNNDMDY